MEDLKSCVQRLDSKNMPQFLDQVSNVRDNETSRHFAISLYAELAHVHKQEVIPFIPRIMGSIVRSLPFSSDTQQLHEACAKVVSSLARYTIDPTKTCEYNQKILSSLCSPLLPVLVSKLESSAVGAAVCFQALVESEKWKLAPFDLQSLLCTKATNALALGGARSVALLRLMRSLAKFSKNASQEHIEKWLRITQQILQTDSGEPGLWQQRMAAAQLIATLVRTTDVGMLDIDLHTTTQILEACQMDKAFVVRNAVEYALEAVKNCGKLQHSEVNTDFSEHDEAGSFELGSQTRVKNSETEESGLHDLSDSTPRSGNSSHDDMLSTTYSMGKCALGSDCSLLLPVHRRMRKPSHEITGFECTANGPETTVRRVLSEIPTSGKILRKLEVLPTSKPSRVSSLDMSKKAQRVSVESPVYFGPENGRFHSCKQAQDVTMRNSPVEKQHGRSCQSVSHMGCMCSICSRVENVGTARRCHDSHATSIGQSSSSIEDALLTEKQVDGVQTLSSSSVLKIGSTIDDGDSLLKLTGGGELPSNACTDAFCSKETSDSSTSGCSTASIKEGQTKAAKKSPAVSKDFAFRSPQNLMASLCSSCKSGGVPVQSCKEGTSRKLVRRARDVETSSEEYQQIATSMNQSIRSCLNEECIKAQWDGDGDHREATASHRKGEASARGLLSIVDNSEGKEGHHSCRTMEDKGLDSFVWLDGHPKLSSAGMGPKSEDVQHYGGKTMTKISKGQMCTATRLWLVCAIGMVVLACIVIRHAEQSHELHALVPT